MKNEKLKVLDLFSGIGGFSLGLERTGGFETVAFCEIEEFPQKVLRKHWPDVPIFEDVRSLTGEQVGSIDVITGGFPCQPFSTASAGKRTAVDLWPAMFSTIKEFKPKYIIAENVQEVPIAKAQRELSDIGYKAARYRIGAFEAGADHKRIRWWLCAYPNDKGELYGSINAKTSELQEFCKGVWGWENYARAIRVSNGVPDRVDRLKSLGNAVVPQIPEMIGMAILEAEQMSVKSEKDKP